MRRRPILSVLTAALLLAAQSHVDARIGPVLDYRAQFEASDLVVIAEPSTATKDTAEKSVLQGITSVDAMQRKQPVRAIGVETQFQVSIVLKGDAKVTTFALHHYRLASLGEGIINGPLLVFFDIPGPSAISHSYLMFLKHEPDGRYQPTGGQVDPALHAVFPLPPG